MFLGAHRVRLPDFPNEKIEFFPNFLNYQIFVAFLALRALFLLINIFSVCQNFPKCAFCRSKFPNYFRIPFPKIPRKIHDTCMYINYVHIRTLFIPKPEYPSRKMICYFGLFLTPSTLGKCNRLFHSLFWKELKLFVGVKGLTKI